MKAVYQYIKFALLEKDVKKNTVSVNINNTYDFITLNGYELLWETVENGNTVGRDSMLLPAIAPDMSQDFALKLSGTNLAKAAKNGNEVMVNLYVRNSKPTEWSSAGHVVAQKQFELSSRGKLPALKANGRVAGLKVEKGEKELTVGNAFIFAAFDTATGRMTELRINGLDVIYGKQGFLYDNHRFIENDRRPTDTSNGLEPDGTCNVTEEKDGKVVVTTLRSGSLCDSEIIYTFLPNGVLDMDVKLTPRTKELYRAGLVCAVNAGLDNVDYYAYGPWENYIDRKEGCMIGRYSTTVDDMVERYVKPQSMGNRESLRELKLTGKDGCGIRIETEGAVAFSALRYTDADLMNTQHMWELQKRPYIVLHLDAQMRGLGNGSCGPMTLESYKIAPMPFNYKLRISYTD